MELELGRKFARVADEFTSADFQLAKDRSGPLFLSTETDTMFILTAHLRGYRNQNIKIEMNEDGTRIVISGEKEVQETVMIGWRLHKRETEFRGFRKGFKIPDGVILDQIREKFDEDKSVLTISMPKKEKGIRGVSIEEAKEEESSIENIEERKSIPYEPSVESTGNASVGVEKEGIGQGIEGNIEEGQTTIENDRDKENDVEREEEEEKEDEAESGRVKAPEVAAEGGKEKEEERGRFKICTPIVAGSALLLSIVVIVIHYCRSKYQPGKRKN